MPSTVVLPGQPIIDADENLRFGNCVYEKGQKLISTSIGTVNKDDDIISVQNLNKNSSPLPDIDSIILGKVIRLNSKQATIQIDVIDGIPCKGDEGFQAILRSQDVRQTDKDRVKMHNCVRPGDIIKCLIISLGDVRSYYVSTARNDLGVVFATSEDGHPMIPVSWESMKDPQTLQIEYRKCAKPSPI